MEHCTHCSNSLTPLTTYRFEGATLCYDCWYDTSIRGRLRDELQGIRDSFEQLDDHTYRTQRTNSWVTVSRVFAGIAALIQTVLVANVGNGVPFIVLSLLMIPVTVLFILLALRARNTTTRITIDLAQKHVAVEEETAGQTKREQFPFREVKIGGGKRGEGGNSYYSASVSVVWHSILELPARDKEDCRVKLAALAMFFAPEAREHLTRFALSDEYWLFRWFSLEENRLVDYCAADKAVDERLARQSE